MDLEKPRVVKTYKDFPKDSWSPSRLNQIANVCSQQHAFQRIERRPVERKSPNPMFGIVVDEVIFKPFYMGLKEGRTPSKDELITAFHERWKMEMAEPLLRFDDRKPPKWWKEKGENLVEVLIREAPDMEVVDVDVHVVAPMVLANGDVASGRALVGVIDLLTKRKGGLVIVDFKTSGRRPSQKDLDEDFQSVAYTYAIETLMPAMRGKVDFAWHYYLLQREVTFDTFSRTRTRKEADSLMRTAQMGDALMAAGVSIPRRKGNWACDRCAYRGACDELLGR